METTTQATRTLLQNVFDGLTRGDSRPFVASLSDDFRWVLTGRTRWSRTYEGKEAVMQELMRPLFANFATQYTNTALRIIAEGEWAAVECRGNVQTRRGERYDNQYCWVCRVQDGRLKEVVEYLDTQLVDAVLQP